MPTDSNPTNFLSDGATNDALALTMFMRVVQAFRARTLLWNTVGPDGVGDDQIPSSVVSSQVVESGNSYQFPIIGIGTDGASYQTPGNRILGTGQAVGQATVKIDDEPLVAAREWPINQIQKSHFDILGPGAAAIGKDLADDFDKKLFITGVNAALTGAKTVNSYTIHNGGNTVTRTDPTGVSTAYPVSETGANNFIADVADLAYQMDEDSVPEDDRYLIITPYIRQVLGEAKETLFSKDYIESLGINNVQRRLISVIKGFKVLAPTLNLPSTNITTGPTNYQGNFTFGSAGSPPTNGQPVALALCGAESGSGAIGYVAASNPMLGPIHYHQTFEERYNVWFQKAQMMVGAGPVSVWNAGAIMCKYSA